MRGKTRGIIYKYTNKINGKIYIGQTTDEKRRRESHKYSKADDHFHRAIRKNGWDNFEYEVVFETISSDKDRLKYLLDTMEKYFIKKYDSYGKGGYNCTLGGGGSLGYIASEQTKKKLSEINRGKILSEKTRKKMSESRKGRKISEENLRKLVERSSKATAQYTPDGVLVCTYKSIAEAVKQNTHNNWSRQNIGKCARGKNKTAYGYIWRYTN